MSAKLIIPTTMLSISMLSCGAGNGVFLEQREITNGDFNGLSIGMDRDQVLTVVRRLGAHVISAAPCESTRISKVNIKELPALEGLEGIRVADARNSFADIYFSESSVSRVVRSPVSSLLPTIQAGASVADVRKELLTKLESQDDLSMMPIVDRDNKGTLSIDIGAGSGADMQAHRCWQFEVNSVKPAGATYELTFGLAGLKKVLYRRARIRTE